MAEKSSHISHALFRKESGWSPSHARSWLKTRGVRGTSYETMHSKGGDRLKRGTYYVFRTVPDQEIKRFTSFGYSNESKEFPGVWFKFGGFRASECGCLDA